MKGIVVYDTYYGNTKKVAEAMAAQVRAEGHEAELRSVREKSRSPLEGDFMFVGSPIRFGKVSRRTKRFAKKIDVGLWKGKPVAVFVTVVPPQTDPKDEKERANVQKWVFSGGPALRDLAKARGLNVVDKVLHVGVKDWKGPLADNAIEQTKEFVHDFVSAANR